MIFTEINLFLSVIKQTLNKSTKLNKWRNDILTEIFILYMVIPNRINFKQMGRYSDYGEQRFRNKFSKSLILWNSIENLLLLILVNVLLLHLILTILISLVRRQLTLPVFGLVLIKQSSKN